MLDEGQAIVFANEFTLEAFIRIPGIAQISDFHTCFGLNNDEPGALAVRLTVKKLTYSTAGKA
jgi:hypothetical protein